MQYATGTTRKRVSTGNLGQLQIPIAPLEEQKRIANKVNELMTFCDQLEAQQTQLTETRQKANRAALDALADFGTEALLKENWARTYTNFDRLFRSEEDIGKLKDTILQLAFRGKLVPQNPKHVPSDLFVQSIKDEVRELRYEHGVKREKAKPATYEIRLPYELPAGWSWVTFSDIGFIGRGKSKHRPRSAPELFHDGTYPFLQTGDVSGSVEGYIKNYSKKYNDKGLAQSKLWPTGTLCITIAANIAETGILSFDACFPDSVVGFIPAQSIGNPRYFEYFVRTAKSRLEDFAPSTAQKNINLTILENVLIPLPPIEELHQIVKKIEYLFSLCDLLAKHFRHARELQSNLALASVHKVVARDYELVKTTEDRKPVGKRKILEVIIRLVDEMKKQIENTVLAKILTRHERDMDAKELWEKSALTIDEFYATLKREIKEGFIAEPDVATLKLVEGAD
jgi:type I restriction enzyme S subunit